MAFPWEQVIKSGIAIAGNLQARSKATGAEKAQAGAEFDARAAYVAQVFHAIQTQTVITMADLNAAEQLVEQLQSVADTVGDEVPYIREQWESSAYKPAFENGLRIIRERATLNSIAAATPSGYTEITLPAGLTMQQLLLISLAAFVGIKLLKG